VFQPLETRPGTAYVGGLDLPFFLFIVGVSIAAGIGAGASRAASQGLARGVGGARCASCCLPRAAARPGLLMDTRAFRPLGVLQRIGLCYGAVGLLAIPRAGTHARGRVHRRFCLGYGRC